MQRGSLGAQWMRDAQRLASTLGLSNRDARAEAELLLTRALGITKARLLAHPELAEQASVSERYRSWLERRVTGEPIAYILGEREFYGLLFEVDRAVLIPRPETELLVELALARMPRAAGCAVLDVGTGSGCVGVTLAHLRPLARVVGTDLSADALDVAMRNAVRHAAANFTTREGDGFGPVASTRFDLIVSNPPYVAANDPHLGRGDLRFEPQRALTSGADGLDMIRALIARAQAHLHPGGWLLLEHGYDQADAVKALLRAAGFVDYVGERDLAGHPRVAGGRRARG